MPVNASILLDTSVLLEVYKNELKKAETEVSKYKRLISLIQRNSKRGIPNEISDMDFRVANLKWRKEVRDCLNLPHKFLLTSNEIASCVAVRNKLDAVDRNIKTKISATLSLLYSEKEIGRILEPNGREFLYGRSDYFEPDMVTIKREYENKLMNLVQI